MEFEKSFTLEIERTVSWGQMDAFGHVNNVEYFRFFEDARIAYFEQIGIYDADEADDPRGAGPILASTSCDFLAPLTYPDEVAVGVRVSALESDRFTLEYGVRSDDSGRVVAKGDSVVVSYDYGDQHKIEVPTDWRDAIRRVEDGLPEE